MGEEATIIQDVWSDDLNFCACGSPETVLEAMRVALMGIQSGALNPETREPHWLILYVLEAADLLEHGGGLPGWLTNKGIAFLDALNSTPHDEWFPLPE